jgi:hypothetical protein
LVLLDACFRYVTERDKAAGKFSDEENLSVNSKNNYKQDIDVKFSAPDTTNNNVSVKDSLKIPLPSNSSIIPEIKQDSIKRTDSVLSKPDSLLDLKTKEAQGSKLNFERPDSTKREIGLGKDSVKVVLSRKDSLLFKAKQDSIKRIDSLSQDSTARVKYFHSSRDDYYVVPFREKKASSFYAKPSDGVRTRLVEIDSTGKKVLIKELINGKEDRILLEIPIEDYIQYRLGAISRDNWEKLAYAYELKTGKKDLSQLMTDITNIQIPLPSSPLLSIFGKPGIKLKISGAVDIHGAWRNETTEGVTTSALGNTRNEPDFKQQVQINLSGTIGDKLNISADWNTERQFSYENQLKIKYTGYDDEIVQSVEAGNVSLQTSSLVGGSEALFGVKALFKMGPLSLTTLVSQKKSEVQEVAVSGGSKSNEFEVHAYSYSTNHYFLDALYASTETSTNYFYKYYGNAVPQVTEAIRVLDIEVWKTVTGSYNANERKANAFINLDPRIKGTTYIQDLRDSTIESVPGEKEINRRWIKLDPGIDYDLHDATGFITFRTQVQDEEAVAVAYRIKGSSSLGDTYYGEFVADLDTSASTRLVLKLIRPSYLKPQYKTAWKLQLRNIYPIGGRSINESGFTLDIKYETDGGEAQNTYNGKRLIQEFDLDQTDASGTSTSPDGEFDFFKNRTIFTYTGEIIFPVLEPFGANLPESLPESYRYDAIYDTTVTFAKQDNTKDKFLITGTYSASSSSVYSIGFNVVENSVKVYLSGNLLTEGADYTVDYNIGEIVILNDSALLPGADLKITYEQNDLFQLASKTLMGLRGEYTVNKDTKLGFSFLNLNQKTLSDKVRIGEEPMNNSIYGLDLKTTVELPFITKGLDYLIPTSTTSKLNLNAEYAYINPDPNTMKSTITSDNGKSVAYIDDFEGAKKTIPLGMSRGSWKDLSLPKNLSYIGSEDKMDQLNYKAKSYWFNRTPSDITITDIYGDRKSSTSSTDNQITVLDLVYDPTLRGAYNKGNSVLDQADDYKYWGGFMKPLSSSANDLVEENIEFIEFWVRIDAAGTGAKLNIDLGQISEEVIPNGKLDTEDDDGNGILASEADDVGLDGETDIEEGATSDMPDPNNDDFSYSSGNYVNVNGTDGNKNDTEGGGLLPDTEDLNGNYTLDNVDSYYKYEIPLDTTKVNGSYTNEFIQGTGENGWYLFRIPLKDTVGAVGSPSFSLVETIRFWFNGEKEKVHLRFAEMNLVGNQWQKVLDGSSSTKLNPVTVDDTVLTVSTINVEDNIDYHLPPGVSQERDKTNTEYEVYKNEQSLDLLFSNLKDGDYREIVKYLSQTLDVFNYKEMKMYIHTDDNNNAMESSVSYFVDTTNYSSEIYLRFGTDTLNYYEYRQPLKPDASQSNWSEISLDFATLTAIKQNRDSSTGITRQAVSGLPGHSYAVRGKPSLMKVAFFVVGIVNPSDKGPKDQAISGSVWINELRVVDADQTAGWAYTASGSLNIADLMTVNANITQKNPYFHTLSERFGSRIDNLNWGMSVDLDILKLIPANLAGSNFKLAYSRSESTQNPLYMPGTDVKISDYQELERTKLLSLGASEDSIQSAINEIKRNTQTLSVSETWSVSNFKLKIPTEAWYVRDIINNITLGFNYNEVNGRTPTVAKSKSWVWNANAGYSLTTSKDLFFKPVDIPVLGDLLGIFSDYKDLKINFVPQSFTASMTASRKKTFTQNRAGTALSETVDPTISRDFTSTRSAGFNWTITEGGLLNVAVNYNVNIQSTLAYLLTTADPNDEDNEFERSESDIWRDIFNGNLFGKDYSYSQSFDLRVNPKLPSIWDLNRYINITGGYSSSYNWQNNFTQEELGRSAGYSNKVSAGLTVKVKSIFAPLFKDSGNKGLSSSAPPQTQGAGGQTGRRRSQPRGGEIPPGGGEQPPSGAQQPPSGENAEPGQPGQEQNQGGRQNERVAVQDSTATGSEMDTLSVGTKALKLASVSVNYLKLAFKWLLLDYDQIAINFSQTNSMSGGGLEGTGTGFNNFWGYNQSNAKGPSRLFMLGLSNDLGARARGGNLTDLFSQKNDIDLKTSRPLWEGAQLDLTWRSGWGMSRTVAFTTDSLDGSITVTSLTSTGTIDRSFLFLPFSFLGGGIKKVGELYTGGQNLSSAFMQGFETTGFLSKIPFLSKLIKYMPRPNWSFNWTGLEKFSILSFAKKITLQHAYTSSYSEGWKIDVDGVEETQSQKVEYGFSPLAGTSIQLDNFLGGSITGSARYSTKSSYSLGVSTSNITEGFSKDISFSLSYTKSGFEFPLFGISLKNDIEISLSFTSGKTSSTIYYMDNKENVEKGGTPQDGKTNTVIEPKIKYVMSSRVTLSIFYRRTTVKPEGASTITATTSNEAGLDVHIAIQ